MNKILIIFLAYFIASCSSHETKIDIALDLAGDNKKELQKVLTHYQKEEDSLKYKATIFLLESIIGQEYYQISSKKKWERLLFISDSLFEARVFDENHINSLYQSENFKFVKRQDLESITSNELIKNIELAFKVWPKPWNGELSFDDFCNYILPYKSLNERYDIDFRESYYIKKIGKVSDSIMSIKEDIKTNKWKDRASYRGFFSFRIRADGIKYRSPDCIDMANLENSKGRAVGIPMVIDYSIHPNGRNRHYWSSILDDSLRIPAKKAAKIYRYSLKVINHEAVNLDTVPKEAVYLYDPQYIDVTNHYYKTVSATISLEHQEDVNGKTAYLCIFNNLKWMPIALSKVKKGNNVTFENLSTDDITYTVFLKEGKRMFPASQAFTINKKGEVFFYNPKLTVKRDVVLARKSKLRKDFYKYNNIGSTIELSNTLDFKNSYSLYTIKDTLKVPISKDVKPNKQYRYARFISKKGKNLSLAELHFYSNEEKITPHIYMHDTTRNKEAIKAMDNDLLSVYYGRAKDSISNAWIGFDFKKRVNVTSFNLALRSDLNYIEPDDVYELFYWNIGWVSMGVKKATGYTISFEDVPQGAILWLRNLTKGREEDLFVYKDGKQVFWNSDRPN